VKEPLEPWIQRSLLKPLAMNSSSYSWKPEFEKLAAAGHADDGQVKPDRSLYTHENAAYSLYTTPTDYARFLIEMLTAKGDSPHSLRSETVDQMLTRQPIIDAKDNEARGLGWVLSTDEKVSSVHHGGSNGTGLRCFSRFDRSTGSGVVIMTNSVNGARVWAGVLEAMK